MPICFYAICFHFGLHCVGVFRGSLEYHLPPYSPDAINNHHVSKQHLDRYVDEFAFRWDNRSMSDGERMVEAAKGMEGKRLMYKETKLL